MREELHAPVTSLTISLPDWVRGVVDWGHRFKCDAERMKFAIALSRENVRRQTGGPFGCAIFDRTTGLLVGVGVNRVATCNNSVLHGETVAIMMAQERLGHFFLAQRGMECELFTSCAPCAMCLGAIFWSGIRRLVYAATGDDARGVGFDEGPVFEASYDYLAARGVEVVHGLHREAALEILQEYIRNGGLLYNGHTPS